MRLLPSLLIALLAAPALGATVQPAPRPADNLQSLYGELEVVPLSARLLTAETFVIDTLYTASSGVGGSGNMFDLANISGRPLMLTGQFFGNFRDNSSGFSMRVYTRPGTYVGATTTPLGWTLLGQADNLTSLGRDARTPFNIGQTLTLAPGQTIGVYMASSVVNMEMTYGGDTYQDGALKLTMGVSKGLFALDDFGGATGNLINWNGSIEYADVPEPTFAALLSLVVLGMRRTQRGNPQM